MMTRRKANDFRHGPPSAVADPTTSTLPFFKNPSTYCRNHKPATTCRYPNTAWNKSTSNSTSAQTGSIANVIRAGFHPCIILIHERSRCALGGSAVIQHSFSSLPSSGGPCRKHGAKTGQSAQRPCMGSALRAVRDETVRVRFREWQPPETFTIRKSHQSIQGGA